MRCPFSGKPCLLPKEVFVTEVKPNGVHHLFLCKLCGEKYLEQVDAEDVSTQSALEVISSKDGLSHSKRLIESNKNIPTAADLVNNTLNEPKPDIDVIRIEQVKRKLQDAVNREDYESAAALRDILNSMQEEGKENNGQDDSKTA
jgi:protein-arginine kinase activator protein McsA